MSFYLSGENNDDYFSFGMQPGFLCSDIFFMMIE